MPTTRGRDMGRRADMLVDRLDAALARLEAIADRLAAEAMREEEVIDDPRTA